MITSIFGHRLALRGTALTAVVAGLLVTTAWAGDDSEHRSRVYYVTLANQTYGHGFSFPVAATHSTDLHMFEVGQLASTQAAAIAQIGTPVPMFNLLRANLGGEVTDAYGHPFPMAAAGAGTAPWASGLPYFDATGAVPGLYPTATAHTLSSEISFTITGGPRDRFSLLMMMMCTNDGLAGLDSVRLPREVGERHRYKVYAYDAGVEQNTEYSPDVVDPCGLMAPLGPDGLPQVPTNDGNRNSPPSPSQPPPSADSDPSIQTTDPIALYADPTIVGPAGGGNIPADFAWDARKPVGIVTITRVN